MDAPCSGAPKSVSFEIDCVYDVHANEYLHYSR